MNTIQLQQAFIAASTPQVLGLAISLTEQCNFRCTYCYEKFELQAMKPELFDGLKKMVNMRIPSLKHFSLNWFGGEPLLDWQRMVEFGDHCRTLCKQHGVTMQRSTVPTNAWGLTSDVLRALCDVGISHFMVSLDGMLEDHNSTRKLISGRGTFERIYNNLLNAKNSNHDFEIVLRLHLHNDNVESQINLSKKLAEDFSNDPRFKLLPITLGDFGGDGIKTMNLLTKENNSEIEKIINSNFRHKPHDPTHTTPPNENVDVCYAAKPNHIFIRPNGMISKCTSALDRDDNNIGQLHPNGEIQVDDNKALAWSFGFRTGKAEDLSCPYWGKPQESIIKFDKLYQHQK